MAPRDEQLLIVDLTATYIRTGVGVHDLIRRPLVEMSTRVGRKPSAGPAKVSDYVAGYALSAAQASGEEIELIDPIVVGETGFKVVDWLGLEAVLRYCFHTAMGLPRPPLAHPVALALPPHLPQSQVDQIHSLLFERLLVPQLLVGSRPFFAAAGAGVLSCVVLDIGARGEGTEISVVFESQVVEEATLSLKVDEGDCDDWLALQLLEENALLLQELKPTEDGPELSPQELYAALSTVVQSLKAIEGAIGFESAVLGGGGAGGKAPQGLVPDENGEFDVAKALVEGNVDKVIAGAGASKKGKGGKAAGEEDGEDTVEVAHPLNSTAAPLKIGKARHRWLEPLFVPELLQKLKPSASANAAKLGLDRFERRQVEYTGVQEAVGVVVGQVEDVEMRRAVWEAVVVISTGKVANNKALGSTLLPLLSPYTIDPSSESEVQPRFVRYVKTPDYFSEFKERGGELCAYLGSCILAKILLSDTQSKLFMSKQEYAQKGPAHYRLLEQI